MIRQPHDIVFKVVYSQGGWSTILNSVPVECAQLVALALPTAKVADWRIAKDSVQAISCLIEALYLFSKDGKHLLYESSILGILLILQHLGQNQTYLAIITGALHSFFVPMQS